MTESKELSKEEWALAAIVAVVVLLLWRLLLADAYHAAMSDGNMRGVDYSQYYQAAQRWADGQEIYIAEPGHLYDHPFPYSPWMAIIARPMTGLSQTNAYRIWLACMLAAMSAGAGVWAFTLGQGKPGRIAWFLALALITGFRYWPSVCELALGNVHFMLLLLVCLMGWCARRGHWYALGMLVAAGTMLKTWMIGYAGVMLLAAEYGAVLFALGATAGLWTLSFAIVGFNEFPKFVEATRLFAVQPGLLTLSAPGVARQMFAVNEHYQPLLVSPVLQNVFGGMFYVLIIGTGFYVWRIRARGGISRMLLVPLCTCLLLVGLTLCHLQYFILLLPAIWTLLMVPTFTPLARRTCLVCLASGMAAYLLLSIASPTLTPVVPEAKVGWMRVWGVVPLSAATGVGAALVMLLRALNAVSAAAPAPLPATDS